MRKNLLLQGMLVTMLVSGCTPTGGISPIGSHNPTIMPDEAETTLSGILEDSGIEIENNIEESSENLIKQEITTNEPQDIAKNELMVQDILIPEDACLKNTPFMTGNMECVLEYEPNLERIKSEEGANGYFNYWIGDGIEYVTFAEDRDIVGVIINNSYSLNCGLKIGMKETELREHFPMMEKCEKGDLKKGDGLIAFNSSIMNDEIGPLQTTEYDCAYAYVGRASDEEVEEYQINVTIAYSVVAFIKDGMVCKIVLDLPMAG